MSKKFEPGNQISSVVYQCLRGWPKSIGKSEAESVSATWELKIRRNSEAYLKALGAYEDSKQLMRLSNPDKKGVENLEKASDLLLRFSESKNLLPLATQTYRLDGSQIDESYSYTALEPLPVHQIAGIFPNSFDLYRKHELGPFITKRDPNRVSVYEAKPGRFNLANLGDIIASLEGRDYVPAEAAIIFPNEFSVGGEERSSIFYSAKGSAKIEINNLDPKFLPNDLIMKIATYNRSV